ncbi:putative E3 ubiquitin-protein ligase SINA-like 9 [Carex littledalei]|uniref:RING-type E3 ubiquitin transferase n=1 Tax=Carex littledalei TaxID=544730 RepID=A0A833VLM1_9POAL|nr:putative E3 ubiquitin-protein ligase SINA-like 9 [Carex littledalei]
MVRVRANESLRSAMAKRINTQNKRRETSNPLNQREIGAGETPKPPSPREIGGEETPKPPSPRQIVGGETPNPPNPPKAETKRRKILNKGGETLNPPPIQKESEGGETSNPPPLQKEIGRGKTLNPPTQREIRGGETPNQTQREIGRGEASNPPTPRKIGGEETSNPSPPREETGGERETVTIDTDLLDCSICTNPLCPPLYQCINGHVACPSCWTKVQYKCHICNIPVVTRNIVLEKVLEAAHVPCTYANLGCRKSVSYSHRLVHTDTCEFGPSLCPIPGCAHKASIGEWRGHFLKDHRNPCVHYGYGHSRTIRFNEEDPYYTLFGPGKDLFLLVKKPIPNVGNALSLYYIDLPDRGENVFPYELEVVTRENYIKSSVQLKSQAISIKEWKRGEVCGRSLLVPLGFTKENMKIHVLINKELDEESDISLSD